MTVARDHLSSQIFAHPALSAGQEHGSGAATADGEAMAELWQELYTLSVIHQLQWTPGRGDAGTALHRRVSRLAEAARLRTPTAPES